MLNKTPERRVIFGIGPLVLSVMRELVARGNYTRMVNRSGKANAPSAVAVVH